MQELFGQFAFVSADGVDAPFEQFADRPGGFASLHGFVVGGESAVIRDTGPMLQELAKRERTPGQRFVELQTAPRDELERARAQGRL